MWAAGRNHLEMLTKRSIGSKSVADVITARQNHKLSLHDVLTAKPTDMGSKRSLTHAHASTIDSPPNIDPQDMELDVMY